MRSKINPVLFFIIIALMVPKNLTTAVFAHQLSVFAYVEGETLVVEGTLAGKKRPKKGMVYVYDGEGKLIAKKEISPDGTAKLPLPEYKTGLKIIMNVGERHESYWILTPLDIEIQRKEYKK